MGAGSLSHGRAFQRHIPEPLQKGLSPTRGHNPQISQSPPQTPKAAAHKLEAVKPYTLNLSPKP